MLSDALLPEYPPSSSLIHLYVPDCDPVYAQAMATGATSIAEPADPQGNQWSISPHIEDLTPDQISERIASLGEG